MRIKPSYIATGANRASSCSAVLEDGVLVFGADCALALWQCDAPTSSVRQTLAGHQAVVTVVKTFPGAQRGFISGDAEGSIRIWSSHDDDVSNQTYTVRSCADPEVSATVEWVAHKGHSVSAIGTISSGPLSGFVVTGASDGLLRVWKIQGASAEQVQEVNFHGKLPLDIEVAYLPGSNVPILVLGLTDRRIRIYTYSDFTFSLAITLEGHEDWIRCLAIAPCPSGSGPGSTDLLLASGSQDNYIRLWRISAVESHSGAATPAAKSDDPLALLDEFERKLAGEAGGSTQISTKAHVLAVEDEGRTKRYNVTLEALLVGHESGLTNVHWSPAKAGQQPHLLSTATDNSMILWTPSSGSASVDGIWIPAHRFGAVGGRGLAFYGALWGADGNSVLASGWTGGWEKWIKGGNDEWQPTTGVMGHWNGVASIEWSPGGEYLASQSADQTTRIHAYHGESSRWAEIARPQIHGYDMTCGAWLGSYRFASGADEKLTRVYDAPEGFIESLKALGMEHAEAGDASASSGSVDRPKGATVPPLGLSNRALGRIPDQPEINTQNTASHSVSVTFTELPTEEELATSTLWLEVEKVYGHGYEIAAITSSPDHTLLATACEARNLEHAAVRLSSTETWDSVGVPLSGHTLTVTRIAFHPSKGDGRILTTSRDRSWRLWGRGEDGHYACIAAQEKAHARMINDGCWWSGGFATAGRDKCVRIWTSPVEGQWSEAAIIKLEEGATAVDAVRYADKELLAVGVESGALFVYDVRQSSEAVTEHQLANLPVGASHVRAVIRLGFRPGAASRGKLELASCSDDRSVRVFELVP